ncbi:MAG TPA: class I tRNA ligase family protein, partial [Actinomycetota bacterium]|nr:class I tRNA ligase family protein [Actinomycetota bacterium]
RTRVLQALRERGLVVNEERPYVHAVSHCYRCGSEVEPWLSGKQWFVAVEQLVGPAREAALDGRITFHPERWRDPYTAWLDNLRDWNISRQLWWGHRIPVWYCPNGHQVASVDDPTECRECGSTGIEQDPDVLDTWFSSQLWPFSTLGWPEDTDDLRFFYPTSALVTGYEILYLWVARMIMSGLYLAGDIPFRDVVIHGLVRDERNRKMSKSLGNVIDPLEVIDRYGADALRFALARIASPEQQNIPFGVRDAEAGRNFANKIWNAARLVLSAYRGGAPVLPPEERRTEMERWLLSRHEACRADVDRALEEYRFDDATRALYRFLWSEYCDWGLEMEKPRLYEGSAEDRSDAASVLAWTLERTLLLLHPIMPFVTEEVWRRFGISESIVVADWPEPHPEHRDEGAEGRLAFAEDVVTAIRTFRSVHGLPPGAELQARVRTDADRQAILGDLDEEIRRLARLGELELTEAPLDASGAARLVVDGAEVVIPLQGILDPAVECERIRKRLRDLKADADRARAKLANEGFLTKAPGDVVVAERRKIASLEEEGALLRSQLDQLGC